MGGGPTALEHLGTRLRAKKTNAALRLPLPDVLE